MKWGRVGARGGGGGGEREKKKKKKGEIKKNLSNSKKRIWYFHPLKSYNDFRKSVRNCQVTDFVETDVADIFHLVIL